MLNAQTKNARFITQYISFNTKTTHRHRLLAQYRALPVAERLQTLKDSRPGGTITPSIMAQLRALTAQSGGRVRVIEGAEVEALRPVVLGCAAGAAAACSCSAGGQAAQARRPLAAASAAGEMKVGNGWHVRVRMRDEQEPPLELVADRIVLGTGVEVDVRKDPLLAPFLDEMAVTGGTGKAGDAHCFAGLPVPELSLRLPLSGMEVYVMGPYAALAIGAYRPISLPFICFDSLRSSLNLLVFVPNIQARTPATWRGAWRPPASLRTRSARPSAEAVAASVAGTKPRRMRTTTGAGGGTCRTFTT